MSSETAIDYKAEIDRHFVWFETKLPPRPARFVSWLRRPSSRLVRFPLGLLLILGGIFSILPVLGLWMLPLGLILLAQDIPLLEKPVARFLGWLERKWMERQRSRRVAIKGRDATRSTQTKSTQANSTQANRSSEA